jgi:hypothetical protein
MRTTKPEITHCALSRAHPVHLRLPVTTDYTDVGITPFRVRHRNSCNFDGWLSSVRD